MQPNGMGSQSEARQRGRRLIPIRRQVFQVVWSFEIEDSGLTQRVPLAFTPQTLRCIFSNLHPVYMAHYGKVFTQWAYRMLS
jgi:hypothetical protein